MQLEPCNIRSQLPGTLYSCPPTVNHPHHNQQPATQADRQSLYLGPYVTVSISAYTVINLQRSVSLYRPPLQCETGELYGLDALLLKPGGASSGLSANYRGVGGGGGLCLLELCLLGQSCLPEHRAGVCWVILSLRPSFCTHLAVSLPSVVFVRGYAATVT